MIIDKYKDILLVFIFVLLLNFLCITSSILFSSKLYPFVQKIMNIIINTARITNNEKNPVFDSIFSFDANTLQEVIPKFEIYDLLFTSSKFSYKLSLLIFISTNDCEESLASQEQFAL